jgi:hypothetical protein
MIPYADLERALARWKSRSRSGATEVGGHDIVHSTEDVGGRPANLTNGTTGGEIDAEELVETYDE